MWWEMFQYVYAQLFQITAVKEWPILSNIQHSCSENIISQTAKNSLFVYNKTELIYKKKLTAYKKLQPNLYSQKL